MNFALKREIYSPWCVDQYSLLSLLPMHREIQRGITLELPEVKYNTPLLHIQSKDKRVVDRPYGPPFNPGQLDNDDDFEAVGVLPINGPITKSGGMSTIGMVQLSQLMLKMNADARIKAFVVPADSGGGSSAAVGIMSDTIAMIRKTKPVIGFVEKGGMMCSACFGILSACDSIYAVDKMSIVGSVGTMIQFQGRPANATDPDGNKHIRIYATKSVKKNEDIEAALNEDNYELIINNLLDPINEDFIRKVKKNRPQLAGSGFDNGHHLFAKDAVGTFIDGFKTFDQVVNLAFKTAHKAGGPTSHNVKPNAKKMTAQEIQSAHPDAYRQIQSDALTTERDRVGAWLAYHDADPKAVLEGIKSNKPISATERETLLIKMNSNQKLEDLTTDSATAVATPESKLTQTAEEAAQKAEEDKLQQTLVNHLKTA